MKLKKNFYDEEIICDYVVSEEMKKIWAINLELMSVFKKVCQKHNLKFFMGFGTLLGAFRHQGFIPWDDDVDIIMPRSDFEKLKKLNNEFKEPYFLQSSESDKDFWHRGMMKLRDSRTSCIEKHSFFSDFNQGIGIEILPLDYCSDEAKKNERNSIIISTLQKVLWAKHYKKDYLKNIDNAKEIPRFEWLLYRIISKFLNGNFLKKRLLNISSKHKKGFYCSIYTSYNNSNKYTLFKSEDFIESINMKFENLIFPAPKGFWSCLEQQYGEAFMKNSPSICRKPHHPAIWSTEESYFSYKKRFTNVFNISKDKYVIIFGTGNMLLNYYKDYRAVKPIFYVDNDKNKCGTYINGVAVKSPEVLKTISIDKMHLIICNIYFREIGEQLLNMGINEYFIYTDNFSGLFSDANKLGKIKWQKYKQYKVACLLVTKDNFDFKIINNIKLARKMSEYLLIALDGDFSLEEIETLKAIRYLDKVVFASQMFTEDLETYHLNCVFFTDNKSDNKYLSILYNSKINVHRLI